MRLYLRVILYIIIGFIKELLAIFGIKKKYNIIIDAPQYFHFEHVRSVVEILVKNPNYKITIIKWDNFQLNEFESEVVFLERINLSSNYFPKYDLFITTEYNRNMWWFPNLVKSIHLLHGVGPKTSYIQNEYINNFDYVFSPGPTIKKLQLAVLRDKNKLVESGLPISDKIISMKRKYSDVSLSDKKKTILYAPSWSHDSNMVSMDGEILKILAEQDVYNVIIRPHPLLMVPERCSGKDWKIELEKIQSISVRLHTDANSTIYEVFAESDILISDISSVLYEYMLLDKPVVIYDRKKMYDFYDASEELTLIQPAVDFVREATELMPLLNSLAVSPEKLSQQRQTVLEKTFFLPGTSSNYVVNKIDKILGIN